MAEALSKKLDHLSFFVLGMIFISASTPVLSFFSDFVFGSEIQSRASFPRYHMARLYSRPGFGDQTFYLEVDGERVYTSGDAAPGNLDEKLYWDAEGKIVVLELAGKKVFSYDTERKIYENF